MMRGKPVECDSFISFEWTGHGGCVPHFGCEEVRMVIVWKLLSILLPTVAAECGESGFWYVWVRHELGSISG